MGYEVVEAADGPAALAAVTERRPDLVVLDVAMPRPAGISVCRALRADPATATIPVILLTANAQFESISAGLAAGANGYRVKPFKLRLLVREIDDLLRPAA